MMRTGNRIKTTSFGGLDLNWLRSSTCVCIFLIIEMCFSDQTSLTFEPEYTHYEMENPIGNFIQRSCDLCHD